MSSLETLKHTKTMLLTSFKRDGSPVGTSPALRNSRSGLARPSAVRGRARMRSVAYAVIAPGTLLFEARVWPRPVKIVYGPSTRGR
jgi:hypothetical protein